MGEYSAPDQRSQGRPAITGCTEPATTVSSPRLDRRPARWTVRNDGAERPPERGSDAAFAVESRLPAIVARRERIYRRALVIADVCAALLVMGIAARMFGAKGPGLSALALAPLVVLVNATSGLYRRDELVLLKSTLDEAPAVFQAATLTTVAAFLLESALTRVPMGARLVAVTWLGLTVLTLACRVVARAAARGTTKPERCLVLGDDGSAARLQVKLATTSNVKATLVGRIPLDPDVENTTVRVLGSMREFPRVVREHDIHRVIVAGEAASHQRVLDAVQAAKAVGVRVSLLPRILDVVGSSVAFDYLGGLTLLGIRRFGLSTASRRIKRALDVVGSGLALVVLGPLMALVAMVIKLTSPGPVLFHQTRVGLGGTTFEMLKYRSMYDGADARKAELLSRNEADGLFKIADDPRMTPVGRFLRRTMLDELPQLLNVLRGEMSLVGPRPLVLDEDQRIEGWYRRRLQLTPGMTGNWQVLGASRIPMRDMITIDYLYVSNWSLWDDVKILLRTIPCVVRRRGQ
jgi:exopolysaccharide biosynthesis polyprenyl glycosylphosphotransferase